MKEFIIVNKNNLKLILIVIGLIFGVLINIKHEVNPISFGFLGAAILISIYQLKKLNIKL